MNDNWFQALSQARIPISAWRKDYSEVRLHGSIGRISPAKFAEPHRRQQIENPLSIDTEIN